MKVTTEVTYYAIFSSEKLEKKSGGNWLPDFFLEYGVWSKEYGEGKTVRK